MPLLNFWKTAKEDVLKLSIEQIIKNAGDGNLLDHSECSDEFRKFLSLAPIERLFDYSRHCLEKSFDKSGLALQDIVNEFGRRLEFGAENGLYQGKRNAIGYDGIWRGARNEPDLIVEVKTTDYFTVSLERIAEYKEKLIAEERAKKDSSILIVVGREDTAALEAQIRGSRYAWSMRLISVEGLIKLVQIKDKSDDPSTLNQIRQLLQPFEYTKIDKIIEVIFTTAVNVESQQEIELEAPTSPGGERDGQTGGKQDRTDPELLNAKREQAVGAFATLKGKELVRRGKTLFWSPDKELRVCCAVSKRYENEYQPYWYAFHPKWDQFLAEGKQSYFILSCMDREQAFAIPYSWIQKNKTNLNTANRGDRSFWHVPVVQMEGDKLAIRTTDAGGRSPLEPFQFSLKSH